MCNNCNSDCGCNCSGWIGLLNIFNNGGCCGNSYDAYYAAQYALYNCDSDCDCGCGCSSASLRSSQSNCGCNSSNNCSCGSSFFIF